MAASWFEVREKERDGSERVVAAHTSRKKARRAMHEYKKLLEEHVEPHRIPHLYIKEIKYVS
jgi:hypothetical protein